MNLNEKQLIKALTQEINQSFNLCRSKWTIEEKGTHDYVTEVDISLEKAIKELISQRFPSHQVLGEESMPEQIDFNQPTWIIDPLDGTSNFVFDVPFYGSSIALVYENQVQFAFVCDLINQDIFTARKGQGAYLNNKKLSTSQNRSDYIGLSSGFLEKVSQQKPSLISTLRASGKFRILGAQALHLCYVAAGRFKGCINYETKIWDDIAGALIVVEAGGYYQPRAEFDINNVQSLNSQEKLYSVASAKSLEADLNISKEQLFEIL